MTPPQSLDRKSLLISAVMMVLIVMIAGGMAIYVLSDQSVSYALSLTATALRIEEVYHDEIDWPSVVEAGRNAMFEKLDRYSTYYRKEDFASLDEELEGSYPGIGVSIVFHDEGLLIMSVRENGPAAEVGLLSGDIIIAVDSVLLNEVDDTEALRLLRGEEGSLVRVGVWRPVTQEHFEVEITRRRIKLIHIPFAGYTADSIIYIRLWDFDAGAADDLKLAVDSLITKESEKPRGLILDLRANPGGFLHEGYKTADLFLAPGVFLVGTDGRSRWNDRTHYSTGEDITNGLPMVIIVDRGTASAAEIVAGALQAADRAVLVGDTTFGKGLVQGYVRFPGGDGLRLTIARYYFEGPVYLNDFDSMLHETGRGLPPDHYFDPDRMSPVRRELENSLLLREFAAIHQDEILLNSNERIASDNMVNLFKSYALNNGFSFTSNRTLAAEEMRAVAEYEKSSTRTLGRIDRMIELSRKEDADVLVSEKDYIAQRLLQIAYERKYGIYQTYRQVLIHSRPEIEYATQLLRGFE